MTSTSPASGDLTRALKSAGYAFGAGVPCSRFAGLVHAAARDAEMTYVSAANEGDAVAIAAGMAASGKRAFVLMQNSGLGNALNPLVSLVHPYEIPLLLLVSHRGEPGTRDEPQHGLMGAITQQVAELCGTAVERLDVDPAASVLRAKARGGCTCILVSMAGAASAGDAQSPPDDQELGPAIDVRVRQARPRARHSRLELLTALTHALDTGPRRVPVVATTGHLSRELFGLGDVDHSRAERFYMFGSMGCAASFGLGVSLAGAGRKVVVLDGDGALLMRLGSIGAIGALGADLLHVVFDNGAHGSTGGQPTSAPMMDLNAVALAAGYRRAVAVCSPDELARVTREYLALPGPSFVRAFISAESSPALGRPSLPPPAVFRRFAGFLAEG